MLTKWQWQNQLIIFLFTGSNGRICRPTFYRQDNGLKHNQIKDYQETPIKCWPPKDHRVSIHIGNINLHLDFSAAIVKRIGSVSQTIIADEPFYHSPIPKPELSILQNTKQMGGCLRSGSLGVNTLISANKDTGKLYQFQSKLTELAISHRSMIFLVSTDPVTQVT